MYFPIKSKKQPDNPCSLRKISFMCVCVCVCVCVCYVQSMELSLYYDIKAKKKNPCLGEVYVANGEHKLSKHA